MQSMEKINWAAMEKGDFVPEEQCQQILGVGSDTAEYGIRMMNLIAKVKGLLAAEGKMYHVQQRKKGVYILTDEEVPGYALDSFERARQKMNRAHLVNQRADRSEMSERAKTKHDRALIVGSAYTQAIARERKRLKD